MRTKPLGGPLTPTALSRVLKGSDSCFSSCCNTEGKAIPASGEKNRHATELMPAVSSECLLANSTPHTPETLDLAKRLCACPKSPSAEYLHVCLRAPSQLNGRCFCLSWAMTNLPGAPHRQAERASVSSEKPPACHVVLKHQLTDSTLKSSSSRT